MRIKKIISACCMICLLVMNTLSVANAAGNDILTFTQTEYEAILYNYNSEPYSLESETKLNENLKKLEDHVIKMNEKSNEELEYLGYTDDQIYAIRNYDGSSEMLNRASATVTGSVWVSNRTYENNKTRVTIICDGKKNGSFVLNFQDNLALSLLGSGANFFPSSSHMTVRYADGHTVNATATENDSGVVFRFGIPQMTSFSASYTGVADGDVRVIRYGAAYGHNTVSISIDGISIDTSLTVGISFSFKNKCDKIFEHKYTKEF